MSIAIITVGKRDLQFVDGKNCYCIDNLFEAQNHIKEKNNPEIIKWQPLFKKNDNSFEIDLVQKNKIDPPKNFESSKEDNKKALQDETNRILNNNLITFPLFEKAILGLSIYIKKNKLPKIEKVYLLYTNRQNFLGSADKKNNDRIKVEPYLFAELINDYIEKIKEFYNINNIVKIIPINLTEKITLEEIDLPSSIVIKLVKNAFDKYFAEIKENYNEDIYIISKAGIPDINNALNDIISFYFPSNINFFETDEKRANIKESEYHLFKEKLRIKYELRNRIKNFDFTGANDLIEKSDKENTYFLQEISDSNKKILKIASELLNGFMDEKEFENYDNFFNNPNDERLKKIFENIHEISSQDNAVNRSLLRIINLYAVSNWWGVITLINTTLEHAFLQILENSYPNSVDYKYKESNNSKDSIADKNSQEKILINYLMKKILRGLIGGLLKRLKKSLKKMKILIIKTHS
jgi:hypothetical protein